MILEKEELQVRFNFPFQMIAEAGQASMWIGWGWGQERDGGMKVELIVL